MKCFVNRLWQAIAVLRDRKSALDAVTAAVVALEVSAVILD